jgi:UDP-N-acetylmuramyl pentapeptide phosphotransferase/UDP-N-acetylglucosamine-1-phosphate transferase
MQLIRHRQLTTGALKAIGGALAALLAGILVYRTNLSNALIGAAIIALSANAVNLTDTRPGRSLAAFFVISRAAVIVGYHQISPSIILTFAPPLITAFFLYLFDRSALLMIGDVGANALGALTGLLWIIIAPEFAQVVFLIFLIWFHWWTESHSLSKVIEQTRWLKRIDRKIGVRG